MNRREAFHAAGREAEELEYYDAPTLVFHWLTALLVVVLFGTSLLWNYVVPHDRTWRPLLESTHVSLGILFTVLVAARLVWRMTRGRRLPAEAGVPGVLSRLMFWALYLLIAAVIVLGFLLRWYQGEAFTFFGLFPIPNLLTPDRTVAHQIEDLHNLGSWAIIVLAAGHAAAALFHHYVLRDRILQRMLFPSRQRLAGTTRPVV